MKQTDCNQAFFKCWQSEKFDVLVKERAGLESRVLCRSDCTQPEAANSI